MKILFVEGETFDQEGIKEAFIAEGHSVLGFSLLCRDGSSKSDPGVESRLRSVLRRETPDVVFSLNYLPELSTICQKEQIRYISWVWDSPCSQIYSTTVVNPYNVIYVFDKEEYLEFHHAGIDTVHYLPLAADVGGAVAADAVDGHFFAHDVSFAGSLYLGSSNHYAQMEPYLSDFTKGYLDALTKAQMRVWGYNFVGDVLGPVIDDLYKAYPVDPGPDSMEPRGFFYAQYVINRKITTLERIDLLMSAGKDHMVDFFTDKVCDLPNVRTHGLINDLKELASVFRRSRVNLNISGRSIRNGIPLRAFEIMGAGGFLLSDFQEAFLEYFVPGEDFVYYEDKEDLLRKIDYYLRHEEERLAIARNGYIKVAAGHTYRHRIRQMLDV